LVGFAGGGSGVNGDDIEESPAGDGEVDEMHLEAGKLVESSTCSIACWNGDEEWLERWQRLCAFGCR
jgi:hypothetical protein